MKAALCVLLLAAVAYGADEKKNEKRGLLGLGYGAVAAPAPIVSHGFYDHGLYGHGLAAAAPIVSHGYYGHGLGLYGHGIAAAPAILDHSVSYSAPLYSSVGLGHGFGHGLGHGWH